MENAKRNITIDIVKLFLAFMVVGLHGNLFWEYSALLNNITVNGVFRIAVPVFFTINGFYFYNVKSSMAFNHWIKRVSSLYLTWMLVYSYFWVEISGGLMNIILNTFNIVFWGYGHLWYIISMLQAGVILYLMRMLSTKFILLISVITFSIGVFLQYSVNYDFQHIVSINLNGQSFRNFAFFGFPFISLGFLINREQIISKISKNFLFIGFFVSLLLLLSENYINYKFALYKGFDLLISLYILTPILFMFFSKFEFLKKTKKVGQFSNSIYFIHILVLSIINHLFIPNSIVLTFSTIAISLFFSFFILKLNKKYNIFL